MTAASSLEDAVEKAARTMAACSSSTTTRSTATCSAGISGGRATTAVAENGRRALEMVQTQEFDLLLLDIMMPEMNGYEVLRHLKADPIYGTSKSS